MKSIRIPLLLILAVIICLAMVRLGVWQLNRAEQKQVILSDVMERAALPPISLGDLIGESQTLSTQRFRPVTVSGRYLPGKSLYLDNQVFDSKVGYRVFTPFELSDSSKVVLIDRGWLSVGENRNSQPTFTTAQGELTLRGRLNNPAEKPPMWDEDYPAATGAVWQFLPITEIAETLQLDLLSMVVELPPVEAEESTSQFKRRWQTIDDQWVATHHGYAFQWFAMAVAFFIACLVLLVRSLKASRPQQ